MYYNNPMHYNVHGAIQPMNGDLKAFCRQYMNYQVMAQMNDGSQVEGIIDHIDDDGVTMLVPEEVYEDQMGRIEDDEATTRQFGFYGRPRRSFRRYRRRRFGFPFISSLFLFPFFAPYPYYPWY